MLVYADPIELFRAASRGNGGASFVVGLLPSLGIDGLMAIGMSGTYATDEYESLGQLHVLLENPRSGVMLLASIHSRRNHAAAFRARGDRVVPRAGIGTSARPTIGSPRSSINIASKARSTNS